MDHCQPLLYNAGCGSIRALGYLLSQLDLFVITRSLVESSQSSLTVPPNSDVFVFVFYTITIDFLLHAVGRPWIASGIRSGTVLGSPCLHGRILRHWPARFSVPWIGDRFIWSRKGTGKGWVSRVPFTLTWRDLCECSWARAPCSLPVMSALPRTRLAPPRQCCGILVRKAAVSYLKHSLISLVVRSCESYTCLLYITARGKHLGPWQKAKIHPKMWQRRLSHGNFFEIASCHSFDRGRKNCPRSLAWNKRSEALRPIKKIGKENFPYAALTKMPCRESHLYVSMSRKVASVNKSAPWTQRLSHLGGGGLNCQGQRCLPRTLMQNHRYCVVFSSVGTLNYVYVVVMMFYGPAPQLRQLLVWLFWLVYCPSSF